MRKIFLIAIMAVAVVACDDKGDTHTHQWEWIVTTPATTEADGLETETCATCGETRETKPIAKLPDNPIQDRSGTVKIFDGASTVTVQVMGLTTKAEWDNIANKIAGRINGYYDTNPPQSQTTLKEMIDARSVIYIVEPNPIGYTKYKLTGDGKTIYMALSRIDTTDVEDMLSLIYGNGTESAKATPTYNTVRVTRSA